MGLDDYIKAGKIAGEVRENVRKTDWVGKTVYEICEHVEGEIKKRGAKCAFPVNTSINEVAAHYTAEPNDGKSNAAADGLINETYIDISNCDSQIFHVLFKIFGDIWYM